MTGRQMTHLWKNISSPEVLKNHLLKIMSIQDFFPFFFLRVRVHVREW